MHFVDGLNESVVWLDLGDMVKSVLPVEVGELYSFSFVIIDRGF